MLQDVPLAEVEGPEPRVAEGGSGGLARAPPGGGGAGAAAEEVSFEGRQERQSLVNAFLSRSLPSRPRGGRARAQRLVVAGPWLALQGIAVTVDLSLVVAEARRSSVAGAWWFRPVAWTTSLVYGLDIGLRIYSLELRTFLRKISNVVDLTVVTVTSAALLFESSRHWRLLSLLRLVRLVRAVLMLTRTSKAASVCMRHATGNNKRRFISPMHDLDLDLTYITSNLIAMSVPATGFFVRLYRNPITEVRRFLELFHRGKYLVVNLCPELPYMASAFPSGKVVYYDVQDHTPPLMSEFVHFLNIASEWMAGDPERVLAVHCKGGKGRTGSLCCAWLLYRQLASDGQDARNYFGLKRTDLEHGSTKFQGVETPSQRRYVDCVHQLLQQQGVCYPAAVSEVTATPVKLLTLKATTVFLRSPARRMVAAIQPRAEGGRMYWTEEALPCPGSTNAWEWQFQHCPVLAGDLRLTIFDRDQLDAVGLDLDGVAGTSLGAALAPSGPREAGTEPGCLFYFIFHTSFLDSAAGVLQIYMREVDKACKKPCVYNPQGHLTLAFQQPDGSRAACV